MNTGDLPSGCTRVRARIPELVDGGLSLLEEARDSGHLEACRDCGGELEGHRRLLELVRAASAPSTLRVRRLEREVTQALATGRVRVATEARRWAGLGWAAAVLFVCAWSITRAVGPDPAPLELAGLHPALDSLPDWSAAWDGLGQLSRRLAGGQE